MDFSNDTRGFRNNNPGNIKHGEPWNGLAERQDDKEFCQFRALDYGIRAIYRLLLTYKNAYGAVNIHAIIHRYAPSSENHTRNYIKGVVKYVNDRVVHPINSQTDIHKRDVLDLTIMGIIYFENGFQPFNSGFIKYCYKI
jgi:hypothetical protein